MLVIDVAAYLTDQGIVDFRQDTVGGDTFIGELPSMPDRVAALFPTSGFPPMVGNDVSLPGFQVRTRGVGPVDPFDLAKAIRVALHDLRHLPLSDGSVMQSCDAEQSEPQPWGQDENGRHEYSVNFTCKVKGGN